MPYYLRKWLHEFPNSPEYALYPESDCHLNYWYNIWTLRKLEENEKTQDLEVNREGV